MSREIRKGVNTNLGMMLPGTLVRENTRIKKKYCSGIFIHKALYRMSLNVKDAPILVASFFFFFFSHRARKQMKESDENKKDFMTQNQ